MGLELIYGSTKTIPHSAGLSVCFRQWKADSHCNQLHGYALQVKLDWRAYVLDNKNWVVDFGGLDDVKQYLKDKFDHKLVAAKDDVQKWNLRELDGLGIARVIEVDRVGCEAFAELIFHEVHQWTMKKYPGDRVWLHRVEVSEHESNMAYVERMRHP